MNTDTDHTDGDPPSTGSTILANIGWMANRSSAERKVVAVKVHIIAGAFLASATRKGGSGPPALLPMLLSVIRFNLSWCTHTPAATFVLRLSTNARIARDRGGSQTASG